MSAYGLASLFSDRVWAKRGLWGEYIYKDEKPKTFLMMCLIYTFMGQFIFWAIIYHFSH
jgi:hypothetical protein